MTEFGDRVHVVPGCGATPLPCAARPETKTTSDMLREPSPPTSVLGSSPSDQSRARTRYNRAMRSRAARPPLCRAVHDSVGLPLRCHRPALQPSRRLSRSGGPLVRAFGGGGDVVGAGSAPRCPGIPGGRGAEPGGIEGDGRTSLPSRRAFRGPIHARSLRSGPGSPLGRGVFDPDRPGAWIGFDPDHDPDGREAGPFRQGERAQARSTPVRTRRGGVAHDSGTYGSLGPRGRRAVDPRPVVPDAGPGTDLAPSSTTPNSAGHRDGLSRPPARSPSVDS